MPFSSPDRPATEERLHNRLVELASTPKGAEHVRGLRDAPVASEVLAAALHDYYEAILRQGGDLAERNRALGGLTRDEQVDRLRSRGARIAKTFVPVGGSVYAAGHIIAVSGSLAASIMAGSSTVLVSAIVAYRSTNPDPYRSERERQMFAALRTEKEREVIAERRASETTARTGARKYADATEEYLWAQRDAAGLLQSPSPGIGRSVAQPV